MKLPDLIKQAVLSEDWKAVCAVYTAITGEPLSPPKKKEVDFLNMEIPQELLDEIMSSDDMQVVKNIASLVFSIMRKRESLLNML